MALPFQPRMAPQSIVVVTDLEPDDMVALAVLASTPAVRVAAVVAGEGVPSAKLARLEAYAAMGIWEPRTALLMGCASAKLFPGEVPAVGLPAPFDARAFLDVLRRVADEADSAGAAVVPPLLLLLKPPRELNAALAEAPEEAAAMFARFHLALYGSFNLRDLRGAADWLMAPSSPFPRTVLFESFGGFTNGCSIMNPGNAPALFAVLQNPPESRREYMRELLRTMLVWDEDVVRDCDATCMQIASGPDCTSAVNVAAWDRNDMCRRAVRAHLGQQFVAADHVLVTALLDPQFEPCLQPITWTKAADAPYPSITTVRDGSPARLFMYRGLDWDALVTACAFALARP